MNSPVVIAPLGEWRFDDVRKIVGGLSPTECLSKQQRPDNEFEYWRADEAALVRRRPDRRCCWRVRRMGASCWRWRG